MVWTWKDNHYLFQLKQANQNNVKIPTSTPSMNDWRLKNERNQYFFKYALYTSYNRLLWWQVTNNDDRYDILGPMKGRLNFSVCKLRSEALWYSVLYD